MAQSSRRESCIKVTTVIGRRFASNVVPAPLVGVLDALRAARPDLVHEILGTCWVGHALPERSEVTKAEIEAAVSAIVGHVPAEVLWHDDLAPLSVCRVETDR